MARQCVVTGKKVLYGNRVSKANNKTRRRFLPNLQKASFMSYALKKTVQLRLTANGIRMIEHKGGLDPFLKESPCRRLSQPLVLLKKQVEKFWERDPHA